MAGWRRCAPSWRWPPPRWDRCRWTPCSSAAGPHPARGAAPGCGARRRRCQFRARRTPRSPPRPTRSPPRPGSSPTQARPATPGVAGYAVRVAAGVGRSGPHALARLAVAAAREALAAGFGARQSRPDLRHTGESDDDLVARFRPRWTPGLTMSRPTPSWWRTAPRWRAGFVAGRSPPRRRHPGPPLPTRRSKASAAGLGWYEVSTGAARVVGAGTTRATGTAGSGGGRTGRARVRRRRALVECEATRELMPTFLPKGTGRQPVFETLSAQDRHVEDVLLGIRLRRGLAVGGYSPTPNGAAPDGLSTRACSPRPPTGSS